MWRSFSCSLVLSIETNIVSVPGFSLLGNMFKFACNSTFIVQAMLLPESLLQVRRSETMINALWVLEELTTQGNKTDARVPTGRYAAPQISALSYAPPPQSHRCPWGGAG